jgi:hypothetical protein
VFGAELKLLLLELLFFGWHAAVVGDGMADGRGASAGGTAKPVIFISYSHKDEPDKPADGEVKWLSFVRTYLQPAVKDGVVDLFVDEHLPGGAALNPEIERKLRSCDIFILLVSANSMASSYIVDTEIRIARERQAIGDDVHFYPLLLTPTPKIALDKLKDMVIRPRDAKPFSSFPYGERIQQMTNAADEIADIAGKITSRKPQQPAHAQQPPKAHLTGLPETPYERLVGRDEKLKLLDDAWADRKVNIISLIAEGGAGKSALVNEWLKRLQIEDYRGAELVLGWSFYSQGSKERATSAEGFLDWALDKLGVKLETTSATARGDAIAEELIRRRVLLVLDGVEPLQHGLDTQQGELKDQGLRALLRRLASVSPGQSHGLIVLTSRLPVKDIVRWKDVAAPIENVEQLSDEAGADLLRDNGVWGTDGELKAAAHEFGGHPLALNLFAAFMKEKYFGDERRRDRLRPYDEAHALIADPQNPRHDHARRVMESYEREWLKDQPVLLGIMYLVGLFDRPASGDCLKALRSKPAIQGLTEQLVKLSVLEWRTAVARLREVRLLAPVDPSMPDALDAHPLVREWFGERLKEVNEKAWREAHGRLYEHLRDNTREGDEPTLEDLAPLYQAIAHGCRGGRYQEALDDVYADRVCRRKKDGRLEFYASKKLGAMGSNLAAISSFFDKPYEKPVATLSAADQPWLLSEAAFALRAQGRFGEALPAQRAGLRTREDAEEWHNAAIQASNLSETELLVGAVDAAVAAGKTSIAHADRSGDKFQMMSKRATGAAALHAAGQQHDAELLFTEAERRQREWQPYYPLLYSVVGYYYCNLVLAKGDWAAALERATQTLEWAKTQGTLRLDIALDTLTLGRALLGLGLAGDGDTVRARCNNVEASCTYLNQAIDGLRASGATHHIPRGLLAHAVFRRSIGDWKNAMGDLDEIEEIAEPGPMKLYLCDMAFEHARLALAKIEAFAPLNGMLEKDNPPKPIMPDAAEIARLKEEAAKQIKIAADYIEGCGYHRRDEELAELQAVLRGEKKFADLPPRV